MTAGGWKSTAQGASLKFSRNSLYLHLLNTIVMPQFRNMTPAEIAAVESLGSSAEAWSQVSVADDFTPFQLLQSHLEGKVVVGSGARIIRSRVCNYHIGDGALELVARLMREAFPGDFIVRLGGDEFLICLVGERSLAFLEEKANRLLQSLLEAFQVSDYLRVMSASIGIASSADPGTKLDDLVRQSDIAMYAAKQSGKSRCCVYSSGLIKK